jgi:hypothetical protein
MEKTEKIIVEVIKSIIREKLKVLEINLPEEKINESAIKFYKKHKQELEADL